MIFLDSNIWCYYFDESSLEHQKVTKVLEEVLSTEDVVVNTVVLMEVAHFLVKNLGPVIGKAKIEILLEWPMTILDFNYAMFAESVDELCSYSHFGIGGRDATILAAMKKAGISKILTHDSDFKEVDWVEVVDPIV